MRRRYRYISVVPELNDYTHNPEMYCNLAREDPMIERCVDCKDKTCKHAGRKTVFMKEEMVFGG